MTKEVRNNKLLIKKVSAIEVKRKSVSQLLLEILRISR